MTSHNAFGYLGERYGFSQLGITGLTPEAEPSPKALAATIDFVRAHDVTTIYYETLVSPAIADTVASETGAATAVLDPIEGLTDEVRRHRLLPGHAGQPRDLREGPGLSMTTPSATPVRLVELRAASLGYDGAPVVEAIDLVVATGDVLALVGPNGSGKSTLVKAVLGLADVTGGDLELFGRAAADFRDRGRIGYVPQRGAIAGIVPTTVVGGGRARAAWVATRRFRPFGAADRAAVAGALEQVGLTDLAGARVTTLSGGQQRRVLIARALAGEPELLVLDEPLAGVDFASQEQLAQTLRSLCRRRHDDPRRAPRARPAAAARHAGSRGCAAGALVYDGPVTPDRARRPARGRARHARPPPRRAARPHPPVVPTSG